MKKLFVLSLLFFTTLFTLSAQTFIEVQGINHPKNPEKPNWVEGRAFVSSNYRLESSGSKRLGINTFMLMMPQSNGGELVTGLYAHSLDDKSWYTELGVYVGIERYNKVGGPRFAASFFGSYSPTSKTFPKRELLLFGEYGSVTKHWYLAELMFRPNKRISYGAHLQSYQMWGPIVQFHITEQFALRFIAGKNIESGQLASCFGLRAIFKD